MSVLKKVRAVEKVFQTLENEITNFKLKSNLTCIENCHLCCAKSDIQANILEFLPLAYHLYQTHQAYEFLEKLEQNQHQSICALYNPFNKDGACMFYPYRGLICRLFGNSAMMIHENKKDLICCKLLKTQKSVEYKKTEFLINHGLKVPLTSDYYMRLYAIDLKLSTQYFSINDALKNAIETILFDFRFNHKTAM